MNDVIDKAFCFKLNIISFLLTSRQTHKAGTYPPQSARHKHSKQKDIKKSEDITYAIKTFSTSLDNEVTKESVGYKSPSSTHP